MLPKMKTGILIFLSALSIVLSGCGGGGGGSGEESSPSAEGAVSSVSPIDSTQPVASTSYSFRVPEAAYEVNLLGVPGNESVATAVNESGQVVGNYQNGNGSLNAFLWENGAVQTIAYEAMARDINAYGEIVGHLFSPKGPEAFLYDGSLIPLNPLGGTSQAFQINDQGHTVGRLTLSGESAFIETVGSFEVLLPEVQGYATAIGSNGDIAITELTENGGFRALLWDGTSLMDLGSLGGDQTQVKAINGHGQVVGWSRTASGEYHGFIWEDGRLIDLGRSGEKSCAVAINDIGQVLVRATNLTSGGAYLWENGSEVELGNFGAEFAEVHDMNANGDIVGWMKTSEGEIRAFLARKIQN